jgi:hypothetical protein
VLAGVIVDVGGASLVGGDVLVLDALSSSPPQDVTTSMTKSMTKIATRGRVRTRRR